MLKSKMMAAYVGFALLLIEEEAHAQQAAGAAQAKTSLKAIINDGSFNKAVTIAFGILAFWKWFEFFQNFKPEEALRQAITPAILTFLAFSWTQVLGWIGFA